MMTYSQKSFVAAVLAAICALTSVERCWANPLLNAADPDAAVFGKTYWMYPTTFFRPYGTFHAFSSSDLRSWTDRGIILNFRDVKWLNDDGRKTHEAWAPTILLQNGRYYFYYAVGPQTPDKPSRIGVAVGSAPQGPFKDSGHELVSGGDGFEAIDPMVYTDAQSNKTYLYAGGSAGATLRVWELNDDLISVKKRLDVPQPQNFTEGVFFHERNGVYYLSYSHGSWNHADYSVHYSTSDSPLGPWTYRGCILSSDATHKGPGHHSFIQNPGTGDWLIVYHRWETKAEPGPYDGDRKIAIEKIQYNADGTIQPVKMTNDGPPAEPIH